MKAVVSKVTGGPETLEIAEMPDPEPMPGEVVVSVKAAALNYPDLLFLQDLYQAKTPRPFIPGSECAGTVAKLGAGVTALKIGDRVSGGASWGCMAEAVSLPASACAPLPETMSFEDGAALKVTYGTSLYALENRANLKAGETLLVLGASGGVGLSAVELGRIFGARVIAAASTQEKVDLALKHGAEAGIVYGTAPLDRDGQRALTSEFKRVCGNDGADVIYDPVGGSYAEPAIRALAWEGRYLVIGFVAGIPSIPLNLTLLKGGQIMGVFYGHFMQRDPDGGAALERRLYELCAKNNLRPYISARYPLAGAREAFAALALRRATGKIVLTVG